MCNLLTRVKMQKTGNTADVFVHYHFNVDLIEIDSTIVEVDDNKSK